MFFYRDETRAWGEKRASERGVFSRPGAVGRGIRRALLALLLLSGAAGAFAANGSCDYATGQGTGPADFSKYCWIDFSGYNNATAQSAAGQNFTIRLPQGTLTFNLKASGGAAASAQAPLYGNAAFGNTAFTGFFNSDYPTLYQIANGTTTTFTLSNIVVHVSAGDLPYTFVAADAESTNNGESLSFTTSGNAWSILAYMQNGTGPNKTGEGTQTVEETGVNNGSVGAYAFASDFPANKTIGSVTATLVGSGLQGVAFGIKYHAANMTITSSHTPSSFAINGTGSYKLVARNKGPEANHWGPNDVTTVTDTLPTGLTFASASGTGWTCSASGQVVTCTSPDTTPPNTDMNPITINVNVAGNAPTTVTNTATVANPYDYDSGDNSTTDPTPVLRPDLSTSTKSVVDTNGGDTNPGDTLEYTVTVKESNGVAASNVSVSDDMPTGVSNFTVISKPAGSTDTSSATGGANGDGQLNIGNISVPANGSVSIVYDVTVSAGDTPGQTIDNTADITIPVGTGATPIAPTVTVSQSQIPVIGNKLLYVLDNSSLTRTPPTGGGNGPVTIASGSSSDWTLNTVAGPLQKPLSFEPNSTVSVNLMVQCGSQGWWFFGSYCNTHGNKALDFTASLYASIGGTLTQIGSTSANANFDHTTYNQVTTNIDISNAVTIPVGGRLVLRVTNGNNGNSIDVEQYSGGNFSNVNLQLSTVINVDSVKAYSAAYPSASKPTNNFFKPGDTVYIRAVISDPFGSFDVDPANGGTAPILNLKKPDGSSINLNPADMTEKKDSGGATKTFEYAYTLPANAPTGYWTPSVTAWEGTEHTVSDTSNGSFDVRPMPSLLIMKSVQVLSDPTGESNPHALPGAILRYSINVTNQGQGTADSNSVVVTDPLPADVSFIVGSTTFSDGSPSSGLTLPAGAIEYCSNGTCPYTSTVTAGNPDSNITKIIFKPQGVFAGKASSTASAPQFTIDFKVQLH